MVNFLYYWIYYSQEILSYAFSFLKFDKSVKRHDNDEKYDMHDTTRLRMIWRRPALV